MSGKVWTWLLLEALQNDEEFQSRGFTASFGPSGGVVVTRAQHFRGIWNGKANKYVWTGAGYSESSFSTSSLPEAVNYTLSEVLRT
jgi:hypothetical protein